MHHIFRLPNPRFLRVELKGRHAQQRATERIEGKHSPPGMRMRLPLLRRLSEQFEDRAERWLGEAVALL